MAFESLLSISLLVLLHSFGNSFAALNIIFKRMFAPIGKMVLKRLSGKTKCEPCLYVTNSASQSCDFSDNRFSALLTYFAAFHKQSSSAPIIKEVTTTTYCATKTETRKPQTESQKCFLLSNRYFTITTKFSEAVKFMRF